MSEYHSFSLTQHLPLTKKKEENTKQDLVSTDLDSLLNHPQTFQHARHHTAPVNSAEFHPLLDFLPFDDNLIIPSHHRQQLNQGSNTLDAVSNFNATDPSLFSSHHEQRSMMSYFDGIQDHFVATTPQDNSVGSGFLEFTPSRISTSVHSRMTQGMVHAGKIKPVIQTYLQAQDPIEVGERTVIIMTSKVAQKSYGTEKRFLCPPPTATLVGSSWWTPPLQPDQGIVFRDKENVARAPPSLTICISGENTGQQSGRIEWYDIAGTVVGQTGGDTQKTKAKSDDLVLGENKSANDDWYCNKKQQTLAGGRCVLKRLYINDADEKRKKVECLVKVQLANGLLLGTLASRGIKVISKPSKKRQSVKNVELCIYHGTTVSLFNRIRSQTVSTKYLGVSSTCGDSSLFDYPGRLQTQTAMHPNTDTCFVARTSCWDPFIVWIVDHTQGSNHSQSTNQPEEYIGCPSLIPTIPYPNPPTIALKNKTNQPLAVRYNQRVVLQCLTTGLVSPVMIIRKVDKASTVVGGAQCPDGFDPSFSGGGEYGDEVLGDPVSQLHKIALQIIQPQSDAPTHDPYSMMPQAAQGPVTYLACLNDLVGTHKATQTRSPIKGIHATMNPTAAAAMAASESLAFTASSLSATLNANMARKRRASLLEDHPNTFFHQHPHMYTLEDGLNPQRRRVSSLSDAQSTDPYETLLIQRSHSISTPSAAYQDKSAHANRKHQIAAHGGQALAEFGAYWSEDVTDAAVWTIVGTECARYTFWTPPYLDQNKHQEKQTTTPLSTPFPCLTHFTVSSHEKKNEDNLMTVSGENFTRDLQIWFGDIKAAFTEYKSRDMLVCKLPPREELLQSIGLDRQQGMPYSIRILLVRGDGVVYKTNRSYTFH